MKKLYFLFFLTIMSLGLFAQIDVKKEYPLTYANIAKNAANEWPDDYTMQKYVIDQQCKAYNEFKELRASAIVPKDIMTNIMVLALKDWCKEDWVKCTNTFIIKDPNKTSETSKREIDSVQACWSADWTMIVYIMKQQIEAYNSLK